MMAANFAVEPLDASFGAKVTGLDIRELSDTVFAELYDCWLEYGLLIFPGQFLSNAEQSVFARRFGELEFDTCLLYTSPSPRDGLLSRMPSSA